MTTQELVANDLKKTSADWAAECDRPPGEDGVCARSEVPSGVRQVVCNQDRECFVRFALAPEYIGPGKWEEDDRYEIQVRRNEANALAAQDLGNNYVEVGSHDVDPNTYVEMGPFTVKLPHVVRDDQGNAVKGPMGGTMVLASYTILLVIVGDKQTSMGREHIRANQVSAAAQAERVEEQAAETNAALPVTFAVLGVVTAALVGGGVAAYVFLVPSRDVTLTANLPPARP